MLYFVEVVLPLAVPKTFTYQVSEAEFHYIQIGMRVAVPFGKTKIYTALVLHKNNTPPQLYEAKEIHQILDESPVVNSFQIEHWKWIATYYMCSLGEVFRSALPAGYILESETIISAKENLQIDSNDLKDDEYLILEALKTQSSITVQEVIKILGKKTVFPICLYRPVIDPLPIENPPPSAVIVGVYEVQGFKSDADSPSAPFAPAGPAGPVAPGCPTNPGENSTQKES